MLIVAAPDAEAGFNEDAIRIGRESAYGINLIHEIERLGIDTVGNWTGDPTREMTGRQAWDELMARVWPDVSAGAGQQIVLYAPVGDHSSSYENVHAVFAWLMDPANAIPLMADKLCGFYATFKAAGYSDEEAIYRSLFRYNTGSVSGTPPSGEYAGNVANYRNAVERAKVYVANHL